MAARRQAGGVAAMTTWAEIAKSAATMVDLENMENTSLLGLLRFEDMKRREYRRVYLFVVDEMVTWETNQYLNDVVMFPSSKESASNVNKPAVTSADREAR